MKVKELIARLNELDPEDIVVMSKDSEGNSYSPLADIDSCVYAAETTWNGEIGLRELTDTHREQGYTEDDLVEGENAVCLWPTN